MTLEKLKEIAFIQLFLEVAAKDAVNEIDLFIEDILSCINSGKFNELELEYALYFHGDEQLYFDKDKDGLIATVWTSSVKPYFDENPSYMFEFNPKQSLSSGFSMDCLSNAVYTSWDDVDAIFAAFPKFISELKKV